MERIEERDLGTNGNGNGSNGEHAEDVPPAGEGSPDNPPPPTVH